MDDECKKEFERISEFLDNELDDATREKIKQHLESCSDCKDCIDSLKKSINLCKKAAKEQVTKDMHERLTAALKDYSTGSNKQN